MSKRAKELGAELHRIVGPSAPAILTGKVGSASISDKSCTVTLTGHDSATEGVTLNVKLNNSNGVLMVPANGADCLVADVDGSGRLELLKASAYTKITLTAGNTVLDMDGTKFKINAAGETMYHLLKDILKTISEITVSTGTGPSGTPINTLVAGASGNTFTSLLARLEYLLTE
jgi:hypothetical protein